MTDPRAFSVCIGMDAFRICIGIRPINFTAPEVLRWMKTMLRGNPNVPVNANNGSVSIHPTQKGVAE